MTEIQRDKVRDRLLVGFALNLDLVDGYQHASTKDVRLEALAEASANESCPPSIVDGQAPSLASTKTRRPSTVTSFLAIRPR